MIQSFWHGKSLQKIYKMGTIPPNSLKENFEDAVKLSGSSLSSNVQKLICESFVLPNNDIAHKVSNKEFNFTTRKFELLDESLWREIESVLGEEILKANLEINYFEAVRRLCPLCHAIHKDIIHLEQLEFEEQFRERLQWTGCNERFIKCLGLLKSSNPADHILCLLLLTSSLEHALGDVYLSFSGSAHCPSLLKDLLATSELKDVFGETVMRLLFILIGPPSSLNLRNVLWHGFVAPGEVAVQYASFLLVITASMFCKLENEPFCSSKIRRRPLRKLSVDAGMQLSVFPLIKISDMPEVLELFHANFFIIPNMLPLWLQAVDYFVQKRSLVDLSIRIQNNSSAQHKANCVLMNEISYQLIIDPHNHQLPVAQLVEHCTGIADVRVPVLFRPFFGYCSSSITKL